MVNVSVSSIVALRAESLTRAPYLARSCALAWPDLRFEMQLELRGNCGEEHDAASPAFAGHSRRGPRGGVHRLAGDGGDDGPDSWLCNSATVSSFSSLSQLGAPGLSAARGDQAREPAQDASLDTGDSTRRYDPRFAANVQVWVHVITPDGTTGNVSQALIDDQIVVLNNTYGGGEGGVDTGFSFTLAGVDRTVNADWYYANPGGKERAMKRAL